MTYPQHPIEYPPLGGIFYIYQFKQNSMSTNELIHKWELFTREMISIRKNLGLLEPVYKVRAEEKIFMAAAFISDLGGDPTKLLKEFEETLNA